MQLKIYVKDLVRIPAYSRYNHNYYKIPIPINNCSFLFGKSDDYNTTLWELGNLEIETGKFERTCYLGESYSLQAEGEYINLSEANVDMIWT